MIKLIRIALLTILLLSGAELTFAQYYSWGADRAALRWQKIGREEVEMIYPTEAEDIARRSLHYVDAVGLDIGYDFKHSALRIPFVIHPENFNSNGMVMWAPLRVEFLSTPDVNNHSTLWLKHLVAHEYRHAVQYNNLDRSTLRVLNYLLGQQGAAASLLFPPLYALEGDAVMCETQMSTFGRGLQPSFTMGYRAMADEIMNEKEYLKWRCGSYRTAIPDHYAMGYQLLSYAYSKYNENILDKTFAYIARNPQFIAPYAIALRKYYDTSSKELFYESFDRLTKLWSSLPIVEPTSVIVAPIDETNFTTYSHPNILQDGSVLTLKRDYEDPTRFVIFDPKTVTERVVAYTGSISTRPSYAAGRVWWTEHRRSALFEQDRNSQLCYMDLTEGKPKSLKGFKNALYPTPIGDSTNHIAYVEYDPSGQYSVVELVDGCEVNRVDIACPNEVHSLAWDNATKRLYVIVTGEGGMWIEQQAGDNFVPITKAAYVTISDLTAHDGVLYFGSIASGRDELHSLDILSGQESQLSESTYGSFQAAVGGDKLYMTTYDKYGYHLASQNIDKVVKGVEYAQTPINLVNPTPVKWNVVNLDTVKFDSVAMIESEQKYKSRKYSKSAHLFNVHSWIPISFNPYSVLGEQLSAVGLGVTLVSQNLLSSCDGYLSYGWNRVQGSHLKAALNYDGLGVDINLGATYGGQQNFYLIERPLHSSKNYYDATLSLSLPLHINRGYHTTLITPYVGWNYSNGVVPHGGLDVVTVVNPIAGTAGTRLDYDELKEGLNKFSIGVTYADYVRAAMRDINIPKGYVLSASFASDPTNSDFSKLVSLYGKLYTPGFAQNNSFMLSAAYQTAVGGFEYRGNRPLSYVSSSLVPTGFTSLDISNDNYFSSSAQYQFPLCYPERSALWDIFYFKRLSLGVGVDYAQFNALDYKSESIYSYGVDFMIDLNVFSMSPASTSKLTLSFYKPKDKSFYFQFNLGLPIN